MLTDKSGNRLFRKVTVKVIFPDNIFQPKTFVQHAGAKQGFGPTGVDAMLESVSDQLESLYPYWEFKLVELAPEGRTARYVMDFAGYRSIETTPNAESNTPEAAAPEDHTTDAIKAAVGTTLQELVPQIEG